DGSRTNNPGGRGQRAEAESTRHPPPRRMLPLPPRRRLLARLDIEPGEDFPHVPLRPVERNAQLLRDLRVGVPLRYECVHFALPRRQDRRPRLVVSGGGHGFNVAATRRRFPTPYGRLRSVISAQAFPSCPTIPSLPTGG